MRYILTALCLALCLWAVLVLGLAALSSKGNQGALASLTIMNTSTKSRVIRISQLDPAQYNSSQEYALWAYSTCSSAAIVEVLNAYGYHYRVTDILKVEAHIGEITPQLGLLEDAGIERTAMHFGFKTAWGHSLSLDQVIALANHGTPVIVSFPPARSALLYPGGHLLVVTGGNSTTVDVADSSRLNRTSFSRSLFLDLWAGFTAVVTPKEGEQS